MQEAWSGMLNVLTHREGKVVPLHVAIKLVEVIPLILMPVTRRK
jgi:hypothetical protein